LFKIALGQIGHGGEKTIRGVLLIEIPDKKNHDFL
jgi:hypothetical protein